MTRNIAFALVLLCGVALLWVAADARSITGEPYRALAQGEFVPLVSSVPASPVDAGRGHTSPESARAQPSILPSSRPTPRPLRSVLPSAKPPLTSEHLAGIATWYAYIPGQAAAARALRAFLGPDWRGMVVRVTGPLGSLSIRLTDYESSLLPGRLIDLDASDFERICGPLSRGVCSVEVSR